ncbi:Vacuolar protein sorting-associated protein 55 [Cyberlindnera jadinii]|uniref:Vacuolar protein sorting 55 n=1 Tax=Cyberlindnera jadinii (strain ATCC 18201 / CBS 1600 / BCRC 20928 / JCM 3617 / NBRC 0987 / NRRL Y-1542) TaxID=983966 RepID=A0A0H5C9I5_CYBJN|nr:vacuolar protein sorting 55 [Cyberlindnera jadinii NRRL Y-1542]ODV73973.1 vacuolar protein sorting 55 [Cyberlindnera jadinii NRRL Y-1542]CEP25003.1 Vacuolar protein sorting-associated protein 55 [Cyberlindnera jadinii]
MKVTPLTKIIFLSGFLAAGFLLIILSCALWSNWYPLYVVGIFLLAPLPNTLFTRSEFDDFMSDSSSNTNDFAKFITAFLVASGIALPLVLYHTRLVVLPATIMSTSGGLLIYTSIIVFTLFFQDSEDEF